MSGAAHASFSDLYPPVAGAVYAWANLHVQNRLRPLLDPEDVLQEVSCRVFEQLPRFDPERGAFRGWVFGIARNVLREALRALGRQPKASASLKMTTGWMREVPDEATSVTRRIACDDALQRFLRRLGELADDERRLLIYRGLEGLDHAEVAGLLGVSAEVAAKRWHRLKERLREQGLPPELLNE